MALLYTLKQINRKFSDGRRDSANGKWYAHATILSEMNTAKIADELSYATTVTKADCQAVLAGLVKVMQDAFNNSQSVRLDGIGVFKPGISSRGALEAEGFSVSKHIKGVHINFMPEYTREIGTGRKNCAMTKSIKVQEAPKNAVGVE